MNDSTVDVRERYRDEGLRVSLKEVPDHIEIELEFMYFLIFREEVAKSSGSNKASDYRKKQTYFLKTHLGAWITEFTGNIVANARTPFYKKLAKLTKLFVESDLKNLSKSL